MAPSKLRIYCILFSSKRFACHSPHRWQRLEPACECPALINLRQQVQSPGLGHRMRSLSGTPCPGLCWQTCASPESFTKRSKRPRPRGKETKYPHWGCLQKYRLPPGWGLCACCRRQPGPLPQHGAICLGKRRLGGNMWLLSRLTTCQLPKMAWHLSGSLCKPELSRLPSAKDRRGKNTMLDCHAEIIKGRD